MTGFSEEPRATYSARMDKASFLAWLRTQEGGRYELKNGDIIVHAGSTRRHAWLSARFSRALGNRLDEAIWAVGAAYVAVEIGDDIRYPDVVVERLADDGSSPTTSPARQCRLSGSGSGTLQHAPCPSCHWRSKEPSDR